MNPDDLIDGGVLRDTDLEGDPPAETAQLGPFGRYVLIEELGRGGAAIVYRAHDPLLNRELALKRLRFGDLELEFRFLREAELLAKLSHPGIVPIFDFGKEGDSHYYTMPLAPGLSFDRWITEHRPGATDAARMVKHAAEALAHAHERGVLHRDVKPANMLISAEGVPLLADFGLGRKEDPGASLGRVTESGEVMGTPSYMAPELATRDLRSADARCDVYSLGATLYEALTGQPPFVGTAALEILKKATTEEPVAPRRRAPATPADLEIICLKALEKDPDRRYATAREFADDLGRFLAGEPVVAHRPSVAYRIRRYVSRRRTVVSMALAAVLLAAGVTYYWANREGSERERIESLNENLRQARLNLGRLDHLLETHSQDDSKVQAVAQNLAIHVGNVLELAPGNAEAHFLTGKKHALLFDKDAARRSYDSAIASGPFAEAHLERALLDCQELIVLYAGGISPDHSLCRVLRKSAVADIDAFRRLTQGMDEKHEFALGLLAISQGEFLEATLKLDQVALRTGDWRSYYWAGVAHVEMETYSQALASLEKALSRRRRCRFTSSILERLGVTLAMLAKDKEAMAAFDEAKVLNPASPVPACSKAIVLFHILNDHEAAILELERIQDPNPPPQAHATLGLAYKARYEKNPASAPGSLLSAKTALETALNQYGQDSPQGKELQSALADVLSKLEAFRKPAKDF